MSLHDHEPTGRDQHAPAAPGVPPEEDVERADVVEEIDESPQEQKNFTEDHPRDERMTDGE